MPVTVTTVTFQRSRLTPVSRLLRCSSGIVFCSRREQGAHSGVVYFVYARQVHLSVFICLGVFAYLFFFFCSVCLVRVVGSDLVGFCEITYHMLSRAGMARGSFKQCSRHLLLPRLLQQLLILLFSRGRRGNEKRRYQVNKSDFEWCFFGLF